MKLEALIGDHQVRVRDFDLLSTVLSIGVASLLSITVSQPGNSANGAKLAGCVTLFGLSCAVERMRAKPLETLTSAEEYAKRIQADKIRRNVVIDQSAMEFAEVDEAFAAVPVDRWAELSQRLGAAPPNLEARQPIQAVAVAEPEGDPCPIGYDPFQAEAAPAPESSGLSFVPASQVQQWLDDNSAVVPLSLIEEWATSPGAGIQISDGSAVIVRGAA